MTGLARWIARLLKGTLFLAVFALALRNTEVATVEFLFGYRWSAPLALILLAAFTLGAGAGVLAALPFVVRARREAAARPGAGAAEASGPAPATASAETGGSDLRHGV